MNRTRKFLIKHTQFVSQISQIGGDGIVMQDIRGEFLDNYLTVWIQDCLSSSDF